MSARGVWQQCHRAAATTLYGIDSATATLVIQNPPNSGTLTAVGSGLGVGNVQDVLGFDVVTLPEGSNVAFATMTTTGTSSTLYTIDLTTGKADDPRDRTQFHAAADPAMAIVPPRPVLTLTKLTNGTDNDAAPGPSLPVGSTVTFTYIVNNVSPSPLALVAEIDDNGTPGNPGDDFQATFVGGDTNGEGRLDPDETWTFTASRVVTPGRHTNTAFVRVQPISATRDSRRQPTATSVWVSILQSLAPRSSPATRSIRDRMCFLSLGRRVTT